MKAIIQIVLLVFFSVGVNAQGDYCALSSTLPQNWHCMGPFTDYYGTAEYNGRVDFVWTNPNDMGHIMAAANLGGLWVTHDTGHNWHCLTDNVVSGNRRGQVPGVIGPVSLAVSTVDTNVIYMQIGMPRTTEKSWGYSLGMVYTLDGGKTWKGDARYDDILGRSLLSEYSYHERVGAKFMPDKGWLFAYSGSSVIVKRNARRRKWKNISPKSLPDKFNFSGFDFCKRDPNKVVFIGDVQDGRGARLCVYDVSAGKWNVLTPRLPSEGDTLDGIQYISVSGLDSVFLFVSGHNSKTKFSYLVKGALNAETLTVVNNAAPFRLLTVSPVDQNVMYAAHPVSPFLMSTDGGVSFTGLSRYGGPGRQGSHSDPRCLTLYSATKGGKGDVLFGGTDGGIVMKTPAVKVFSSITGKGICITQFYGLSNTELNEDYMVAGAQDHGIMSYIRNRHTPWELTFGGSDGFLVKLTNRDTAVAYLGINLPRLRALQFKDTNIVKLRLVSPNDMVDGCMYCYHNPIQRPIFFDNNNAAYVGYRKVWKKTLAQPTWEEAFNGSMPLPDTIPRKVGDIIIAEQDSNIAYVAYRESGSPGRMDKLSNHKLFVSKNASGDNPIWEQITPEHIQWERINDVEINQDTPSELWVGYGDFIHAYMNTDIRDMRDRVEYSPDFGHTWYNVSHGLPNFPVNKILCQKGSNRILYAATDIGVYRCDFSTFDKNNESGYGIMWECFHEGLPDCQVTDMEFNYKSGKLRIATFGRGVWETDIPE